MKPILFNTEMVRAILDGRKTVTRRVVKPQPKDVNGIIYRNQDYGKWFISPDNDYFPEKEVKPPYRPGDILYVRETWGNYSYDDPESNATYYLYRADYEPEAKGYWYESEHIHFCNFPRWRPSIHMPKEAARLFLRVKKVWQERVRYIGVAQAQAEGFSSRAKFLKAFLKMYPDCTEDSWVWVIKFERISKQEAYKNA